MPGSALPYYIYQIFKFKRLEKVAEYASFKDASAQVKALRVVPDLPLECTVKMIFAENEWQAEDLLSEIREGEKGVVGDE